MLGGLIRDCFGKREIAVREVTILLSIYNIILIFNNGDCLGFLFNPKITRIKQSAQIFDF